MFTTPDCWPELRTTVRHAVHCTSVVQNKRKGTIARVRNDVSIIISTNTEFVWLVNKNYRTMQAKRFWFFFKTHITALYCNVLLTFYDVCIYYFSPTSEWYVQYVLISRLSCRKIINIYVQTSMSLINREMWIVLLLPQIFSNSFAYNAIFG